MRKMIAATVIIVLIIIAIAVAVKLTATPDRFKVVERFPGGCVWVDTETGIGYGELYESGEVFPMYNADGTPYRPNGWRDNDE